MQIEKDRRCESRMRSAKEAFWRKRCFAVPCMSARNPLCRQPSGVQRQSRSELDMRTTGMLQSRRLLAYEMPILQVIASGLCACGKAKKAEIEVRATDRLARQRMAQHNSIVHDSKIRQPIMQGKCNAKNWFVIVNLDTRICRSWPPVT